MTGRRTRNGHLMSRAEIVERFEALVAAVSAYSAHEPLFRVEELDQALGIRDLDGRLRRTRALGKLVRRGALLRLTRRTYAVVERGDFASRPRLVTAVADPYAMVTRMRPDATLAYRTALEVYGALPARADRMALYLTRCGGGPRIRVAGGVQTCAVEHPRVLRRERRWRIGVAVMRRGDATIRITTRERTFVDALHRWRLVGSWVEIVPALLALLRGAVMNWSLVVTYVRRLGRRSLAARVGWFVERTAADIVPREALASLEAMRPLGPTYWDWTDHGGRSGGETGRFYRRWNLVVPRHVVALTGVAVAVRPSHRAPLADNVRCVESV